MCVSLYQCSSFACSCFLLPSVFGRFILSCPSIHPWHLFLPFLFIILLLHPSADHLSWDAAAWRLKKVRWLLFERNRGFVSRRKRLSPSFQTSSRSSRAWWWAAGTTLSAQPFQLCPRLCFLPHPSGGHVAELAASIPVVLWQLPNGLSP